MQGTESKQGRSCLSKPNFKQSGIFLFITPLGSGSSVTFERNGISSFEAAAFPASQCPALGRSTSIFIFRMALEGSQECVGCKKAEAKLTLPRATAKGHTDGTRLSQDSLASNSLCINPLRSLCYRLYLAAASVSKGPISQRVGHPHLQGRPPAQAKCGKI